MAFIGTQELLFLCVFVVLPFVVVPCWIILKKAGYPGVLSLLMLVPVVSIVLVFFLAFSEWPILRELKTLRAKGIPSSPTSL